MNTRHFLALVVLGLGGHEALPAQTPMPVKFTRTEDVVYGRKFGLALTLDVFQPEKPNGAAVIDIINGGAISNHDWIHAEDFRVYLERGYVVFAVVHSSPPKFDVAEFVADLRRAVRFIRHNAAKYGVVPDKLGITGTSSGGTLALLVGTQGAEGDQTTRDPVEHESSAVQAVACFTPMTDLLNYGRPGVYALDRPIFAQFKNPGGVAANLADERKSSRDFSPIYFVTAKLPPTLILQGDADKQVPLQQAESFVQRARESGALAKLVVLPGIDHHLGDFGADRLRLADWFDVYLRGIAVNEAETAGQVRQAVEAAKRAGDLVRSESALQVKEEALRKEKNWGELETVQRQLVEARRARLGQDHVGASPLLVRLAATLVEEGKFDEAEAAVREALALRVKAYAVNSWEVANAQNALGKVLLAEKKFSEAEPVLLAAYTAVKKPNPDEHERNTLKETTTLLATFYEVTDQPAKAAEWQRARDEFVAATKR
jgi:acetyl esterase/lipase